MSNFFVFGGQGPWSIFQVVGWGIAGFLGGILKEIKPSKNYFIFWLRSILPILMIVVIGTLLFEMIVNLGWFFFMPTNIFALFLFGLPFLLVHLVTNILFSLLLPFARKIIYEKGHFNEKELCVDIINKLGGSPYLGWFKRIKERAAKQ